MNKLLPATYHHEDQGSRIPSVVVVMFLLAAAFLILAFLTGCQHPQKRTSVDLGGNIKRSQDITQTIDLASQDSKEIKKAIGALQASNKTLHRNNGVMVGDLDRADYKTKLLLQK